MMGDITRAVLKKTPRQPSNDPLNQYRRQKWYFAVKEVIGCLSSTSSRSGRRNGSKVTITTTHRHLTDMEKQEILLFILEQVGGNQEIAVALYKECMQTASAPEPILPSIGSIAFGAVLLWTMLTMPGDYAWIGVVFGGFFLLTGIYSLWTIPKQFPHKAIIEARSKERGGMMNLLHDVTRAM